MSLKLYNQFFCSSLMLPEHREALAKQKKETGEKCAAPCIDEQQFELWERLVQQSYRDGKKIAVKVLYRNGVCTINGVITGLDTNKKLLRLSTGNGEKKVKIKAIRSIEQF